MACTRHSFRTVLALVFSALALFLAAIARSVERLVLRGINVVPVHRPIDRMPAVRIVQAKAFVQRIIQRENLNVTSGGWRMCPST